MSFVISIDGPAASGKSSAAKLLANRLGATIVNSGAMYRAVTWAALEAGIDPGDAAALSAWVGHLDVECGQSDGHSTIRINKADPHPYIRDARVNSAVSRVSAVPEVRRILVEKLRQYRTLGRIVMEGRDIGSVVFPDTPFKYYIDASEEVRSKRRHAQGERDSIAARDAQDSQRKTAPLTIPDGAMVIDSSDLNLEQVVEKILSHLTESGIAIS